MHRGCSISTMVTGSSDMAAKLHRNRYAYIGIRDIPRWNGLARGVSESHGSRRGEWPIRDENRAGPHVVNQRVKR
jgi:hypothetical protein